MAHIAPRSDNRFRSSSTSRREQPESRMLPLKVCAVYGALGLMWVLFEEFLLERLSPVIDGLFVVVSTLLLYWIVDYGIRKIRRSERAVRQSEERMSLLLETNPSGVILFDRKGTVAYANAAASRLLGRKPSDLVGRVCGEIVVGITTPEGKPLPGKLRPMNRVLRRGGSLYDVECAVRHPDGRRAVLSVNSAPMPDALGRPDGMVLTLADITERRDAQDLDLRKLSLALEQSPVGIMITDVHSRIEYVNPTCVRMTGYPPEELVGTRRTTLCDESPEKCARVCTAVRTEGGWKEECEGRRKTGEPYWESVHVSPIRGPDGGISHYVWVREDITERRRADVELRESRARFRSLVETINDWVWEVNAQGVYTYVSPKVRDLLGYEPEEVLGKTPFDLMPSFEAKRVEPILRESLEARRPFTDLESISRHKEGHYVVLETSGVPYFDPEGTFRGYRGVDRDVTTRTRVAEALRESEERFRRIFEQSEEPVLLFKAGTGEILDGNPAAVALYGYSREELVEGGAARFVESADRENFERLVSGIGEDDGVRVDRTTHVRKDGSRILVSIRGKAIRLQEGRVGYVTFRDITGRIRMEEEMKQHQAQLIHANRMASLGTIVSGVAHEINNPNNLIMFNAPMIVSAWESALPILEEYYRQNGDFNLGGLPYSEMREVVPKLHRGISDASVRIKNFVGNLKDFVRRDAERRDIRVDVNQVVKTAVSILHHAIIRGTRSFNATYGDGLPMVMGSAQQLEQVVINLVLNSLQALPDPWRGISVSTRASAETGCVEIQVRDEGEGMPAEVLARIDEPFFSTRLDAGGLGLGLSISHAIVRSHKGTLRFASEPGAGTTAVISLPPADAAAGDALSAVPRPLEGGKDWIR